MSPLLLQLSFRRWVVGLSAALIVGAQGCGGSTGEVAVQGKILYRDQPLTHSSLTFFPATGRPVTIPVNDGEYATRLAPGDYTVTVTVGSELPPGYKEGDPVPPPKFVLPDQYTTRAKSTLKATVAPGQAEPINFELK